MFGNRTTLLAGTVAVLAFTLPAVAQQPPAPAAAPAAPAAAPSGPPGFSAMDKTKVQASQQDSTLAPHPTPPTVTPLEKIPIDKVKLPAGFKAEIWSSGHPGGRTMVMGPKGTLFMGSRLIGRVYAVTDTGGKREVKT